MTLDEAASVVKTTDYQITKPRTKTSTANRPPTLNAVGNPYSSQYDPKRKLKHKPSAGHLFRPYPRTMRFVGDPPPSQDDNTTIPQCCSSLRAQASGLKLEPTPLFHYDTAQQGDSYELLQSLQDGVAAAVVYDPQHRSVLDKQKYGNEGKRQIERCRLPQMTDANIDRDCREIARVLRPSGHLFIWSDVFRLCEGYHLRLNDTLPCVDLIAWDDENPIGGNGYRSRRCGGFLLILQKLPKRARSVWTDHKIRDKWSEPVDLRIHPHRKPTELTSRVLGSVTGPGDLIVDPCAGSFLTLEVASVLGRKFIGVDIAYRGPENGDSTKAVAA